MQLPRNLVIVLIVAVGAPRQGIAQYNAVAVSPGGKVIAAGGEKGRICLWEEKTGAVIQALAADKTVECLTFVRDEKTLAVGTFQGGVEIWTTGPAGFAKKRQFGDDRIVYALAVSADGKSLAAGGSSGWTYLFETNDWKPVGVLFERSNLTCGIAFAPDGTFLATAGNTFSIWNIGTTSPIWKPRGERMLDDIEAASKKSNRWFQSSDGDVNVDVYCADIAVSPDGRRVAGVTGVARLNTGGRRMHVWDAATGKPVWTARSTGMTCVVYTSDGKQIVTGSDDGTVRVWDAATGKMRQEWSGHAKGVHSVAAMPAGTHFVTAAQDGTAALWDAQSGKRIRAFAGDGNRAISRPQSADSTTAAGEKDWIALFDGKSTDAWRGYKQADFPREAWIVEENALKTNPEHPVDLITRDQYENFELELEWKVAKSANSGIMYHVSEDFSDTYWTGPEMQVVDDDNSDDGKEPKTSSGSLYALIAPTNKRLNPAGNWNKARLIVLGKHVEYWLNDRRIVEYELGSSELQALIAGSKFKDWPKFAKNKSGHIALQNHGGTTWYRNIRIRIPSGQPDHGP